MGIDMRTDRELMQIALEELEEHADVGYGNKDLLQALRDRLAQPDLATVGEVGIWGEIKPCKDHPDAPHGFDRNASHSEDRYVCECEYWEPHEPKPIAWMCEANNWDTWKPSLCWVKSEDKCFRNWKPLYTKPKGWVGLTDDEVMEIYVDTMAYDAVRVAEAKLKEKNT